MRRMYIGPDNKISLVHFKDAGFGPGVLVEVIVAGSGNIWIMKAEEETTVYEVQKLPPGYGNNHRKLKGAG